MKEKQEPVVFTCLHCEKNNTIYRQQTMSTMIEHVRKEHGVSWNEALVRNHIRWERKQKKEGVTSE